MKKRYQIDKQRAAQQFRKEAQSSTEDIQFALPLPEVLELVQKGLMSLALAAFTKVAEEMMQWEVGKLVGPTVVTAVEKVAVETAHLVRHDCFRA